MRILDLVGVLIPVCGVLKKNGALGISNVARDLNSYLDDITYRLKKIAQEQRSGGIESTSLSIKKALLGIEDDELKVLQAIQEHNDRFAQLVGKEVSGNHVASLI